jgi:outer membrane protein assembly factor BamB
LHGIKWKFRRAARSSTPAVSGGTAYFGSNDHYLYAVNLVDGQLRWKFVSEGERRFTGRRLHGWDPAGESLPDPFEFYLSSPTIDAHTVYVGSGDGTNYALDAGTGSDDLITRLAATRADPRARTRRQ